MARGYDRVKVPERVASSSIAWPIVSSPPYLSGGVTPAGSATCATFSVIDTRL
jgi:hypothetical protein